MEAFRGELGRAATSGRGGVLGAAMLRAIAYHRVGTGPTVWSRGW